MFVYSFWRSSSTVVMLRSAWSVWFETYRGAPAIILNVLDRKCVTFENLGTVLVKISLRYSGL